MDAETGLRLRVLGGVAAFRDGTAVDLGGRRQRAVLAVLVVSRNQAVPADRLADCVWGDAAPANSTGAIQAYVSHLRRRLQPEVVARQRHGVIASTGAGYVLRLETESVDAWRFERAVQRAAGLPPIEAARMLDDALRLWRGPPYAEYAGQSWAQTEVLRLDELRAVARERLLAARLDLGEAAVVVGELEALVAADPLREERWRLLALALYRSHRQADALAALRRARTTLADELGVDPGAALRSLEADLLAQSPALDVPPLAPPAVTSSEPATTAPDEPAMPTAPYADPTDPAEPVDPTDLVERGRETAALRRAVADVVAGTASCLLVEGPAGIGKTRLIVEVGRLAADAGVRVLSARASAMEQSYGFGVVRQLFEPHLTAGGGGATALDGAAAGARAVFEEQTGAPEQGGFAVLHGLFWATVNLASQGPLALCVDDVQWGDSASLRYLAYLVRRLDGLPVLVVLGRRPGEPQRDDGSLDELALDPAVTVLRPAPLSADGVGTLVSARLGDGAESFVGACHRMTSGNPLLLRQLLRALEEAGIPPDVAHVDTVRAVGSRAASALVTMRLRRMPADVTVVARAVAVLGEAAGLPTLAALSRLTEERVVAALTTLSRGELLTGEHPPAFVHPLIRDAVYDDLPAAERALHHERAAAILRQEGAASEQVAAHLLRAPRRGSPATVAVLRHTARGALSRGASEAAVPLLRRALDEPVPVEDRTGLLVELGLAESLVDGTAGVAHLAEAHPLLTDPRERARVGLALARTHAFVSPPGVATEFAARAAAAVPHDLHDERQGLIALQRITGYMHGLPDTAYRTDRLPEITGEGDGARMLAAVLGYELLRDGEERERAVELSRFALERDRLLAVDSGLLWVFAATVLLLAGEDLGDFWDRAQARAHQTGGLFTALTVSLWRGFTQWQHGQLDDALQSLNDATEQQCSWGLSPISSTYAAAFTVGVLLDRGDLVAAEESLAAAGALPWVGEGGRLLAESGARLHLELGRPAEALELLGPSVGTATVVNPVWTAWRGLQARALAALGRSAEALALAEEELALLRRWGAAPALGAALRRWGELRGVEGTPDLREAVELLSGTRAVLETARARLALASRPDVADVEATALLAAALDAARACGATSLARDAGAVLVTRGSRTVDTAVGGTGPSARQRSVRELTAAGLSVNEVAQRLFLTPGTVRAVLESLREVTS